MDQPLPLANDGVGRATPVVQVHPTTGDPTALGKLVVPANATAVGVLFDLPSPASASLIVQLLGTWAGTVVFEASLDGTNWFPVAASNVGTTAITAVTSATAPGVFAIPAAFPRVRARCSAFTSGAIQSRVYLSPVMAGAFR